MTGEATSKIAVIYHSELPQSLGIISCIFQHLRSSLKQKKLFPAIFISSSQVAVTGKAILKIAVVDYSELIQCLEKNSCIFKLWRFSLK